MAGFRTVVLKSKDGGEERNEEEEQGDEDGVLLSEVTEWQSDRVTEWQIEENVVILSKVI